MVLGVWLVLTAGALLAANAMDDPVGAGARDAAQPAVPGEIADAPATVDGTEPAGGAAAAAGDTADEQPPLPPFAMVLDHRMPADLAGLPPAQQAVALRTRAMSTNSPVRLVELGSVLQFLGDLQSADFSYRAALKADPGNIPAQVGLAVVAGGEGAGGLDAAARNLRTLAAAHPRAQIVTFNQAWVEIYRGRAAPARAALERTVALGPDTRLGRTSTALLTTIGRIILKDEQP